MRVLVIANERAGGFEDMWFEVLATLRSGADVDVAEGLAGIDELVTRLRAAEGRLPVVIGGDGSVHALLTAAHRLRLLDDPERNPFEFAIVPLGTGNDLARTLDLPLDPVAAARIALDNHRQDLDVLVDDTGGVAVNVVHLGVSADAGHLAAKWKGRLGRVAYPAGALVAGITARGRRLRVDVDDGDVIADGTRRVLMVALGNGATIGGGAPVAPRALPADGRVDVMVSFATGRLARIGYTVDLLRGRHPGRADVVPRRASTVTVTSDSGPVPINADGELSVVADERTWTVRRHAARVAAGP